MGDDTFRVDGIDHVELFVPGRREAAAWYGRVLGLVVLRQHEHWAADPRGPLMISSDNGGTKLALFRGTAQGQRETAGFHRVAFRVDAARFARFVARLDELELIDHLGRAVTCESLADHDHAWSLYFCDPYGHRLELTTYDYAEARRLLA